MGTTSDELKWLGREVGAVRDADVLRERRRRRLEHLADRDRSAGEELLECLDRDREAARRRMLRAMSTARYDRLLDGLIAASRCPPLASDPDDLHLRAAERTLTNALRKRWRQLHRTVAEIDSDVTDEDLHEIRIASKRCRYATELAGPVSAKGVRTFANALNKMQTELGNDHDSTVAETWLRKTAITTPTAGFVAGYLTAAEVDERADQGQRFDRLWTRVLEAAEHAHLRPQSVKHEPGTESASRGDGSDR